MQASVRRIARISLVVRDLDGTTAFYAETLGFQPIGRDVLTAEAARARFGPDVSRVDVAALQLGGTLIELVRPDPPGAPYPTPRAANDPWFQHFAIAVSDMGEAYARLAGSGAEPISRGGPQRLPPSTGSVVAYKFRDPEGHPLELSYIPGSAWTDPARRGAGPFLGVDHTALAVADLRASLAFYTGRLGFALDAQLLNTGPEQDRLDGLTGVALDIAVLRPSDASSPHLELLAYRAPRPPAPPAPSLWDAVAATRTRWEVDDRRTSAVLDRLTDPDGHRIELTEPSIASPAC